MADKNWNDSLRERMSEFEQTPPEGLWEALESSGAVGAKAGAAAGAGLLGKLFGGSRAPLWWSLAGVAAVAAAVLLLRTPGTENPVVNASESTIAEVVEAQADTEPALEETSPEVSDAAGLETAPEVVPAPAKPAPSYRKEAVSGYAQAPDASEIVPDASEQDQDAVLTVQEAPDADVAPADNQAAEEESATKEESVEPATREPSGNTVVKPAPVPGSAVVPLSRNIKRSRPLLAASFVGAGMPGSTATSSETVYGLTSPPRQSNGGRAMVMASRNKETEVVTSHRIDYQMGLMFNFNFSDHWGVESGLEFTHLGSAKTSTTGSLTTSKEESFDYLGVPLRVVYTPLRKGVLSGYLSAGPEVEYGISHIWSTFESLGQNASDPTVGRDRPGDWIFSGSLNAGLQVSPWRSGAFFVQPGVVYRLPNEKSPESYYTDHPFSFRISAGYRVLF